MYKRSKKEVAELKIYINDNFNLPKKVVYEHLRHLGFSYPTIEKYYKKKAADAEQLKEIDKLKEKLQKLSELVV